MNMMKKPHHLRLILPLALWCVASFPVQADDTLERTELSELVHEFDYLTTRVDHLAADAHATGRIQFRYPALRKDIQHIRNGINRYLDAASQAPNTLRSSDTLTPISGDYLKGATTP